MERTPKLPLDQELQAAVAIVRIGLDRIRDAACRTEAVGPHAAALQALYDPAKPDAGVLAAVADVVGTITVSMGEVDHDDIDRVTELLDEAQGHVQDSTGDRIRHALDLLAPLLLRCETCGKRQSDVTVMDDPYAVAVDPDRAEYPQMTLCPACATDRFEDS
ncbi:hypothetical protein QFZ56_008059 [Streptomyces achromogenes]|uniref:Uncharacterized protein n=1 Tax=Streptomyces achromogenes TaxID=67255 RepID=A0ABU0QEC7_STRAH|nr:hypothetical protein [Streptomyces achromogenes]MDQ0689013.1 hypothetical protein [Streptomyces achromogenes]